MNIVIGTLLLIGLAVALLSRLRKDQPEAVPEPLGAPARPCCSCCRASRSA